MLDEVFFLPGRRFSSTESQPYWETTYSIAGPLTLHLRVDLSPHKASTSKYVLANLNAASHILIPKSSLPRDCKELEVGFFERFDGTESKAGQLFSIFGSNASEPISITSR